MTKKIIICPHMLREEMALVANFINQGHDEDARRYLRKLANRSDFLDFFN